MSSELEIPECDDINDDSPPSWKTSFEANLDIWKNKVIPFIVPHQRFALSQCCKKLRDVIIGEEPNLNGIKVTNQEDIRYYIRYWKEHFKEKQREEITEQISEEMNNINIINDDSEQMQENNNNNELITSPLTLFWNIRESLVLLKLEPLSFNHLSEEERKHLLFILMSPRLRLGILDQVRLAKLEQLKERVREKHCEVERLKRIQMDNDDYYSEDEISLMINESVPLPNVSTLSSGACSDREEACLSEHKYDNDENDPSNQHSMKPPKLYGLCTQELETKLKQLTRIEAMLQDPNAEYEEPPPSTPYSPSQIWNSFYLFIKSNPNEECCQWLCRLLSCLNRRICKLAWFQGGRLSEDMLKEEEEKEYHHRRRRKDDSVSMMIDDESPLMWVDFKLENITLRFNDDELEGSTVIKCVRSLFSDQYGRILPLNNLIIRLERVPQFGSEHLRQLLDLFLQEWIKDKSKQNTNTSATTTTTTTTTYRLSGVELVFEYCLCEVPINQIETVISHFENIVRTQQFNANIQSVSFFQLPLADGDTNRSQDLIRFHRILDRLNHGS